MKARGLLPSLLLLTICLAAGSAACAPMRAHSAIYESAYRISPPPEVPPSAPLVIVGPMTDMRGDYPVPEDTRPGLNIRTVYLEDGHFSDSPPLAVRAALIDELRAAGLDAMPSESAPEGSGGAWRIDPALEIYRGALVPAFSPPLPYAGYVTWVFMFDTLVAEVRFDLTLLDPGGREVLSRQYEASGDSRVTVGPAHINARMRRFDPRDRVIHLRSVLAELLPGVADEVAGIIRRD